MIAKNGFKVSSIELSTLHLISMFCRWCVTLILAQNEREQLLCFRNNVHVIIIFGAQWKHHECIYSDAISFIRLMISFHYAIFFLFHQFLYFCFPEKFNLDFFFPS